MVGISGGVIITVIVGHISEVITNYLTDNPLIGFSVGCYNGIFRLFIKKFFGCLITENGIKLK